ANTGRAIDRWGVPVERVEVNRMVDVPREAADDIGGGIVWKRRRSRRRAKDIQHVIDGLDDVAVAHAEPLIGRLNRELIATARIALLIEVQAFKPHVECWVRLGLLATTRGGASA